MKEYTKIIILLVLMAAFMLSNFWLDLEQNNAILKTKDVLIQLNGQDARLVETMQKMSGVDSDLLSLIKLVNDKKQDKLSVGNLRLSGTTDFNRSTSIEVFAIDSNNSLLRLDSGTSNIGILSSSFTPVRISKEYCEMVEDSNAIWKFNCYREPISQSKESDSQ